MFLDLLVDMLFAASGTLSYSAYASVYFGLSVEFSVE